MSNFLLCAVNGCHSKLENLPLLVKPFLLTPPTSYTLLVRISYSLYSVYILLFHVMMQQSLVFICCAFCLYHLPQKNQSVHHTALQFIHPNHLSTSLLVARKESNRKLLNQSHQANRINSKPVQMVKIVAE